MNKPGWAAALAAALITLTVAACSGSSSTPPPAVFTPATAASASAAAGGAAIPGVPANPVPLVVKAGARPDPGAKYGSTTADGWLTADGTFPGGNETISLYTLPAGLDGQQALAQVGAETGTSPRSSDSQILLTGPDWYAYVYPDAEARNSYPVAPARIAARLGGQVVQA